MCSATLHPTTFPPARCRCSQPSGPFPRALTAAVPSVSHHWQTPASFTHANYSGPVLVAPSVIPDPQTLGIKAIHNGVTVQDGHTKDMIFNIKKQISYLSQGTTLEAGTIFLTGTPAGIGYFREPRVVLRDGDEISVQIDQIGTLVNKVRYDSR